MGTVSIFIGVILVMPSGMTLADIIMNFQSDSSILQLPSSNDCWSTGLVRFCHTSVLKGIEMLLLHLGSYSHDELGSFQKQWNTYTMERE
jgi:hypothetical protein